MTWKVVQIGSLASITVLLAAVWLRPSTDQELDAELQAVLKGLIDVETRLPVRTKPRVAVGYGACFDIFANARDILEFHDVDEVPARISNDTELMKAHTYFFRHGAAAERFVQNGTLFDILVERAELQPGARWSLGGNAAVMASRFASEGCEVILGAKMTPRLKKAMSLDVKVVGGEVARDDIHLILEYKADEAWGPYRAPRANRFILHNDVNNPTLSSLEEFKAAMNDFEPDLFVVGGLQMMDSYPFPPGVREARLEKVKEEMIRQSPSTHVHFEMASFAEPELMGVLISDILPYADSLGMNEQELANLKSILLYGNVSMVSDCNPRVAIALDDMREVFRHIRQRSKKIPGSRDLTRIHVHTLAFQAILTVKGSTWKNSQIAAAKASLTANRHVCGSSLVDIEKARLIMDESFSVSKAAGSEKKPLNVSSPVTCWDESYDSFGVTINVCVAPVLVCTDAQQTCGGGDNISSAGLAVQI